MATERAGKSAVFQRAFFAIFGLSGIAVGVADASQGFGLHRRAVTTILGSVGILALGFFAAWKYRDRTGL